MAKKKSHLGPHKYQRVKWGKNETVVWRCALPTCTHYTHPEFIVGKLTICWRCGASCTMTKIRTTRVKPTCDGCMKQNAQTVGTPLDDLNSLIADLE